MEKTVNALADSFFNQHIMIKNEWITSMIEYLQRRKTITPSTNIEAIFKFAFEQWLFSDLRESSFSGYDQCGLSMDTVKQTLQVPVIVQIASICDVGSSFQSQYRKLTYEFHDDTGFEALPDTADQTNNWDNPRRMLRMELSDGSSVFRACETQHIPALSLLTPPGCKVLLVPPLLCRRGIFMLNKNNIHVLGGEVKGLFETGRPVQIMGKQLGYAPIPVLSNRKASNAEGIITMSNTNPSVNRPAHSLIPNNQVRTDTRDQGQRSRNVVHEDSRNSDRPSNKIASEEHQNHLSNRSHTHTSHAANRRVTNDRQIDAFSDEEVDGSALPPLPYLQENTIGQSPPRCQLPPKGMLASSTTRTASRPLVLENTPPTYEEFCNFPSSSNLVNEPLLSSIPPDPFPLCDSSAPRKRPSSLLARSNMENSLDSSHGPTSMTELASSLSRSGIPVTSSPLRNSLRSPPKKRVSTRREIKPEVIVLSDDDEDVKPSTSAYSRLRIRDEPVVSEPMDTEDAIDDFNPFSVCSSMLNKYSTLVRQKNIQKMAFILQKMRFMVGSQRYFVQAVMTNVLEPLRVVDYLWTQKVQMMDNSAELECYIDDKTIVSVLGLTVSEAVAIRNSTDKERRKEGTRRIKATEKQFHRLDLVCEIEFFSDGDTTPVVRSISTMASFLDVL